MSAHGDFFAIERAVWPLVCGLGLNPAVAYLVLARGTWRDNRTTKWSVKAIEDYTGMSRPRAQKAIDALKTAKLVRVLRGGKSIPPLYDIGTGPKPAPPTEGETPAPVDMIWMPNALIDGAAGETPPIELIRQGQDVNVLRLLIDLYGAQNLRDDAGIDRRTLWQAFNRAEIFEYGQYVIFRFEPGENPYTSSLASSLPVPFMQKDKPVDKNPGWRTFWDALGVLTKDLGLLTFIPHIVESSSPDAEILFPIGGGDNPWKGEHPRKGELPHEAEIAQNAQLAGWAMLPSNLQIDSEFMLGQLVPVLRHMRNAQMIGIGRLRYRAKTFDGLEWADKLSKWKSVAKRFSDIATEINPTAADDRMGRAA